jgi:hypothetical protein
MATLEEIQKNGAQRLKKIDCGYSAKNVVEY